jgi:integrase
MARKVKDKGLDSRDARAKLKARGKPYYRTVEEGAHLGYRRLKGRAGTWVARHYAGNQQYEVEAIGTADDLSDADGVAILSYWQAFDKVRERRKERVHTAAGITSPYTVKQAIEDYLQKLEDAGQSKYDSAKRADAHILSDLGEVELARLTTEDLRKWHAAQAKAPPRLRTAKGKQQNYRETGSDEEAKRARKASANRTLTVLKAALNFAWREGNCPSDAAWRRVEPFESVDAARVRYLSLAEAKRLLNACTAEFRPLVQAALQTGCRYGELTRLQVHDFNSEAGTLAIRKSKSGKSRHVVLTDEGVALFNQLTTDKAGNALILPRPDGSPWGQSHQIRPMADAGEAAKIKPAASFHILRHTWASHAVMNGVPLMVVAKNLGHADTRMVEKHYGHLAPSYVADAIRSGAPRFGFEPDKKLAALPAR